MHDVAVAAVAPEGEVSEAEHDHVVRVSLAVRQHVAIDVATTPYDAGAGFQTEPVLSSMPTVKAGIIDMDALELLLWRDVLRCAMWAVALWLHCVQSTSV